MTHSRKWTAAAASGLLLAGVLASTASPATAADKTVFKVVGTTDVFDSHLVQDVIEPDFEAANPDIDLQYISQGTGAAIATAKSGVASAMMVHAAALENQFVADGYSLEQYGRAVFWGDYVLLGPASDPAGVLSGGQPSTDIATALEKVAAAGAQGKADLVSRGGTPGTTVQEHAIWKLTTGVNKCTVPDAQGGGSAPAVNDGGTCAPTDSGRSYPSWYHVTGAGQADNINNANLCNYPNAGAAPDCYVFTDRGTFQYLQKTGLAQNLKVVVKDNAAGARGAEAALINSFHAYAIKASRVPSGSNVDEATAVKFLDFLTSPEEQARIGKHLGEGRDAGFIPSATPTVTTSALPTTVDGGSALTVTGAIKNATPGTPDLDGVEVKLVSVSSGGGAPTVLDTDTTSATGGFSFDTTVSATTTYAVQVPAITKIEDPSLTPVFGDLLTAGTTEIGTVAVLPPSTVAVTSKSTTNRTLKLTGSVSPKATGSTAKVKLFLAKTGKEPVRVQTVFLKANATTWKIAYPLKAGSYDFYLDYSNPGVIETSRTALKKAVVK